jgi:sulfur carrier protein
MPDPSRAPSTAGDFTASSGPMQLVVNGEPFFLETGATIGDVLRALDLSGPVAVEVNESVVPRSEHASFEVHAGDRLEIVHFVGGG